MNARIIPPPQNITNKVANCSNPFAINTHSPNNNFQVYIGKEFTAPLPLVLSHLSSSGLYSRSSNIYPLFLLLIYLSNLDCLLLPQNKLNTV